jgi:sialate O-acetylesterase
MENTPEEIGDASATAYFFASRLYQTLGIPVGVVDVSVGGSYIESWMPEELLRGEFAGEFDYAHLQTKKHTRAKAHHDPCVLYNGMLLTAMGYTAKGFIWYQGCSNSEKPDQYRRLQPAFVKMLRESWKNESMPFYYTQIAPFKTTPPEMMWAQALNASDIPNSAMATTHDVGDFTCIHPADKKTVGDRLAYLALVRDYGFDQFVDPYTPIPVKYEFKNGEAYVTFKVGKMGLSPRSKDLDGFELAGEDGVWYPAKAVVLRGDYKAKAIKVYKCPEVPNPVAVRYAWSTWCASTLYNCFGIPATPFNSTIK